MSGRRAIALLLLLGLFAAAYAARPWDSVLERLKTPYQLQGVVQDSLADFSTVERQNERTAYTLLDKLVSTTFFRIFKVNLNAECKFWQDEGVCEKPDCSVCECSKDEIPSTWMQEDLSKATSKAPLCQDGGSAPATGGDEVDRSLDRSKFANWTDMQEEFWTEPDHSADLTYVNLKINEERYTGYSGNAATRIWMAIYKENCFPGSADRCLEERVFYRLISGLHASITAHISRMYCDQPGNSQNIDLFHYRLGMFPDRLNNLYFTYLFMIRAASKAATLLRQYPYNTGNPDEDQKARGAMHDVLSSPLFSATVFDESGMFDGADKAGIKAEFKKHFRNISRIMDCVQCEKCRMWGKLQILGIGTALKILFSEKPLDVHYLERNEIIAFMNTIAKLSRSIQTVVDMRKIAIAKNTRSLSMSIGGVIGGTVLTLFLLSRWLSRRRAAAAPKKKAE
eukprot:tig00000144_g9043.t1